MKSSTVSAIAGRRRARKARFLRPGRARVETCWDATATAPVEIRAPDRASAGLLVGEAAPRFRAELVETGSGLVVTLEPVVAANGWVFELLALVERWLEACRLPVANVRHGGRSYVITPGERDGDPAPLAA